MTFQEAPWQKIIERDLALIQAAEIKANKSHKASQVAYSTQGNEREFNAPLNHRLNNQKF